MKLLEQGRIIVPVVAGLFMLGATATALGGASGVGGSCTQGAGGTANPIVFAAGKQGCGNIKDYVGCTIYKGGPGSCVIRDPNNTDPDSNIITTVTTRIGNDGSLAWTSSVPGKVFAAGLNGCQKGNACVFLYPNGETSQSGIGYNTSSVGSTPTFTKPIQEAFFCTDLNAQVVNKESDIKPCQTENPSGGLIQGVNCGELADGTVVSVWTPTYGDNGVITGQSMQQCYCNDNSGVAGAYPCNLSGEDDGDPNTLEDCFSKNNGDVEMPTIIELFPDTKSCTSSLGKVSCSCIDNPFTTNCNECTHKTPSGGPC